MKQTKKLAIISEEEILNCKYDPKKDHETVVTYDLKQNGFTLLKMEWRSEPLPSQHLALWVTFEDKK